MGGGVYATFEQPGFHQFSSIPANLSATSPTAADSTAAREAGRAIRDSMLGLHARSHVNDNGSVMKKA